MPQVGPEEQEVPKDQTQPGGLFGPTSFAGAGWAGLNQTNQSTAMANLAAGAAGLPPAQANQLDPNNAGAPGGPLKKPVFGVDKNNDGKIAGDEISEEYRLGRGGGALTGMRLGSMMAQKYTNPYAQLGAVIGATIRGLIDPEAAASMEFKEDEAEYLTKTRAQQEIELNQLRIEEGRIAIETARRGREAIAKLEGTGGQLNSVDQANAIIADPTMPEDVRRRAIAVRNNALASNVRAEDGANLPDNVSSIASRALNSSGINPQQVRSISYTAAGNIRLNLIDGKTVTLDSVDLSSEKAAVAARTKLEETIKANNKLMAYLQQQGISVDFFIDNLTGVQGADIPAAMEKLASSIGQFKGENWSEFGFRISDAGGTRTIASVSAANVAQNQQVTQATKNQYTSETVDVPGGQATYRAKEAGDEGAIPALGLGARAKIVTLDPTNNTSEILKLVQAADAKNGQTDQTSPLKLVRSYETLDGSGNKVTYYIYQYGNHRIISQYVQKKVGGTVRPTYNPTREYAGGTMVLNNSTVDVVSLPASQGPARRRR